MSREFIDWMMSGGRAEAAAGRPENAARCYLTVLTLAPRHVPALTSLGAILAGEGRTADAADHFREAVLAEPNNATIHAALGRCLQADGDWDGAAAHLERALSLAPADGQVRVDLARVLRCLGRLEPAIRLLDRHSAEPGNLAALWERGVARALGGDLKGGLGDLLAQWAQSPGPGGQPRRQWEGGSLQGKSLLVDADQGFGDTLQFVRYLPDLKALGAKVILRTSPVLWPLLNGLPGLDGISSSLALPPETDLWVPVTALPLRLGTTLETIPAPSPYLMAPDTAVVAAGHILGEAEGRRRVGLVWAGSPVHADDRNRSLRLQTLLRALHDLPAIQLFGLQRGAAASQALGTPVRRLDEHMGDFGQVAGLMMHMDLIITVDTAPAHLAGALGRPVWTLLPFAPDWRWMLGREDTPWYPTMRLFRQPAPGDWAGACSLLQFALHDFFKEMV